MSKLSRAKQRADEWAWQKKLADQCASLCSHFDGATPHEIIEMWESGKNLKGRPLSQFEAQALAEAWCKVFGELPPDTSEDGEPDPAPQSEPELPADDTMLRSKDVVRV